MAVCSWKSSHPYIAKACAELPVHDGVNGHREVGLSLNVPTVPARWRHTSWGDTHVSGNAPFGLKGQCSGGPITNQHAPSWSEKGD